MAGDTVSEWLLELLFFLSSPITADDFFAQSSLPPLGEPGMKMITQTNVDKTNEDRPAPLLPCPLSLKRMPEKEACG